VVRADDRHAESLREGGEARRLEGPISLALDERARGRSRRGHAWRSVSASGRSGPGTPARSARRERREGGARVHSRAHRPRWRASARPRARPAAHRWRAARRDRAGSEGGPATARTPRPIIAMSTLRRVGVRSQDSKGSIQPARGRAPAGVARNHACTALRVAALRQPAVHTRGERLDVRVEAPDRDPGQVDSGHGDPVTPVAVSIRRRTVSGLGASRSSSAPWPTTPGSVRRGAGRAGSGRGTR
jgi:hypothetical protein